MDSGDIAEVRDSKQTDKIIQKVMNAMNKLGQGLGTDSGGDDAV